MLKLYSFDPNLGVSDPSPFVLKVETYLRMADIEYDTVSRFGNLKKAPKGKLPFIEDNGQIIADSQLIIDFLEKKYGCRLDKHLSDEQKASTYLISKSLDENLYFALVYSRWHCEQTWPKVKKAFFNKFPFPLRFIVPVIARKDVIRTLKGQGISRHSKQEVEDICSKSFQALSCLIGDKPYIFGNQPCSLDATVFAFLAEFILVDLDNSFNKIARQHSCLVQYCNRISAEFYRR